MWWFMLVVIPKAWASQIRIPDCNGIRANWIPSINEKRTLQSLFLCNPDWLRNFYFSTHGTPWTLNCRQASCIWDIWDHLRRPDGILSSETWWLSMRCVTKEQRVVSDGKKGDLDPVCWRKLPKMWVLFLLSFISFFSPKILQVVIWCPQVYKS